MNTLKTIKRLRNLLSRRDKLFLLGLFGLSVLVALIETIGISAVMPFISVALDFSRVETDRYLKIAYQALHFKEPRSFVIFFGIVLMIFYPLRAFFNLLYFYFLARFAQGRYHLFANRLLETYLSLPYKDFVNFNPSLLVKNIINEAHNFTNFVTNLLFLLSEIAIVVLLYGLILSVNFKITLLLTCFMGISAFLIFHLVTKKIKKEGDKRAEFQQRMYGILEVAFGNFKFIKLIGNFREILERFARESFGYALTNIRSQTYSQAPRLLLEATGFSLIIFVVTYLIWKYGRDVKPALGMIAMFVLAFYRLLPSVNRIFSSYNMMAFYQKALDIVYRDLHLKREKIGEEPISFEKSIELKSVSFAYGEHEILKGVDLLIRQGEKIAFVGESGAGKSTLADLIMGIHLPTKGKVLIDEKELTFKNLGSWRKKIGYLPQEVYLFDGTVGENVAFGREYNEEKIIRALKQARIWDFFEAKEGLNTKVGERGIKLSGGQKQRVGIARAIYGDPEILILDEATSALDHKTEQEIMQEIFDLARQKTLIIITHRESLLKGCENVYLVENGRIKRLCVA